jgi:hypothetical protein
MAIPRNLFNKVVIKARTDLINHPYLIILDVWELNQAGKKA